MPEALTAARRRRRHPPARPGGRAHRGPPRRPDARSCAGTPAALPGRPPAAVPARRRPPSGRGARGLAGAHRRVAGCADRGGPPPAARARRRPAGAVPRRAGPPGPRGAGGRPARPLVGRPVPPPSRTPAPLGRCHCRRPRSSGPAVAELPAELAELLDRPPEELTEAVVGGLAEGRFVARHRPVLVAFVCRLDRPSLESLAGGLEQLGDPRAALLAGDLAALARTRLGLHDDFAALGRGRRREVRTDDRRTPPAAPRRAAVRRRTGRPGRGRRSAPPARLAPLAVGGGQLPARHHAARWLRRGAQVHRPGPPARDGGGHACHRPGAPAARRARHRQDVAERAPGGGGLGDSTLVVQGTAGTGEEALRYGWNYARLLAEGPTEAALVPGPVMRAMRRGALARVEELTRIPADVQDALITILSEKSLPVPELDIEVQAVRGFNLVATANDRDRGVNDLSAALRRRFNTVVLPLPASIEEEVDIVSRRVADLGRALELPPVPAASEEIRRVVTIFRELRRRRDRGRPHPRQVADRHAVGGRGDLGRGQRPGPRRPLRRRPAPAGRRRVRAARRGREGPHRRPHDLAGVPGDGRGRAGPAGTTSTTPAGTSARDRARLRPAPRRGPGCTCSASATTGPAPPPRSAGRSTSCARAGAARAPGRHRRGARPGGHGRPGGNARRRRRRRAQPAGWCRPSPSSATSSTTPSAPPSTPSPASAPNGRRCAGRRGHGTPLEPIDLPLGRSLAGGGERPTRAATGPDAIGLLARRRWLRRSRAVVGGRRRTPGAGGSADDGPAAVAAFAAVAEAMAAVREGHEVPEGLEADREAAMRQAAAAGRSPSSPTATSPWCAGPGTPPRWPTSAAAPGRPPTGPGCGAGPG